MKNVPKACGEPKGEAPKQGDMDRANFICFKAAITA